MSAKDRRPLDKSGAPGENKTTVAPTADTARGEVAYRSGWSAGYAIGRATSSSLADWMDGRDAGLRIGWLDALDFAFSGSESASMNTDLLDELAEALRGEVS